MAVRVSYRTVFLSDIHLGSRGCRASDLVSFLKRIECERLYLVGDVLDMWRLRQRWYWPAEHNEVVRHVLKMAKHGTHVLLIPGNHDEHAREYDGLNFGGVELRMDAVHETADGRRLLVTHGDQFDLVVRHARLLSVLGGWAYDQLVALNRHYNRVRAAMGLGYQSLSQWIKGRVKSACVYIGKFEDALMDEARRKGLDGVVCGHIHKAEVRVEVGDDGSEMTYYNCGDWVESCTALVEHDDGTMRVIDGIAFVEQQKEQKRSMRDAVRTGAPGARPDLVPDPAPDDAAAEAEPAHVGHA